MGDVVKCVYCRKRKNWTVCFHKCLLQYFLLFIFNFNLIWTLLYLRMFVMGNTLDKYKVLVLIPPQWAVFFFSLYEQQCTTSKDVISWCLFNLDCCSEVCLSLFCIYNFLDNAKQKKWHDRAKHYSLEQKVCNPLSLNSKNVV